MSVSIEEKDGCLIVSSVPAAGKNYCLLPLSNPRTARTDNRKSFLCRCLKNEKTAFLSSNKKAAFCCFCSFGGWTSTVGRFWKIGPKKPGNPHEYWKKSGWHLFRHPFLGGSDEIVVRWFNAIWKNLLTQKSKDILNKMRIPGSK